MSLPDLPAILAAILLAPIVLLAPGYFWSRLAGIETETTAERAAWSLLLSLATAPVLAGNVFLLCPYNAATVRAFAALQIAIPAFLAWRARKKTPASRRMARLGSRRVWSLPALMAALAVGCVMDLERGELLSRGYASGDYPKHIFVSETIHRTGVPPVNPVFHPGRPLLLFYYFFWHLLCSIVEGLTGWRLGARATVEGMTAWAAVALFAVVLLLARAFLRPFTRRTLGICWALLFATGLDLVGFLIASYMRIDPGRIGLRSRAAFPGAIDSWNWSGQVTSWMEAVTWVPHHLAAAIVSMTAFLLVFGLRPTTDRPAYWARTFLLAAALASSVGLSIWVTLVFCAFWIVWSALLALRRSRNELRPLLGAALLAVVLAAPFLYNLSRAWLDRRSPLAFTVRRFDLWQDYAANIPAGIWKTALDLAWLGPVYFLEFGIFFVGALFWWRRHRRPLETGQLALAVLAAVSIGVTSIVRSNLRYNDFAWRGTLPAQFVLLLWTAWMLERLLRRRRRLPLLIMTCLVLGFLTVGYDWVWMRAHGLATDLASHHGITAHRAWALKRFYRQIAALTPASAIIQGNPDVWLEPNQSFSADRQTVLLDKVHSSLFGTQGPLFDRTLNDLVPIFNGDAYTDQIEAVARQYSIDVLIVKDTDPAWHSPVFDDASRFRLLAKCDVARAYEPVR